MRSTPTQRAAAATVQARVRGRSSRRALAKRTTARPSSWQGRPAVTLRNGDVEAIILMGGGHIQSLTSLAPGVAGLNPLWEPPWPTVDPSLRRLAAQAGTVEPGSLEGELLSGIGGCNLCCDVFGAHSAGEVAQGALFHGEAGLTTWEVERWHAASGELTLVAELRRTMLRIKRTFSLEGPTLVRAPPRARRRPWAHRGRPPCPAPYRCASSRRQTSVRSSACSAGRST